MDELFKKAKEKGEIRFTECLRTAVVESDIIIVAVGTPENKYGDTEVIFAYSIEEAAEKADCLVIMTEWAEFKDIDLANLYLLMNTPIIIDTRNIIPVKKARDIGFTYKGIGIGNKDNEDSMDTLKKII